MKDSLFEMLLGLFEKTLTEIKENTLAHNEAGDDLSDMEDASFNVSDDDVKTEIVKSATAKSMRVFTYHEQMKLTKSSYQFLMRMLVWEVVCPDTMELIVNQLILSDSHIVNLEETKWTVRTVLAEILNEQQLAFLDLVLYQKEDEHTIH